MIFCLISLGYHSQTFDANYNFDVYNKDLRKTFVFPANLQFEIKTKIKLYKVQFGIKPNGDAPETYFISKKTPLYYIYAKPGEKNLILENIPNAKEKDYVLNDVYEMKWVLSSEFKIVNKIKLLKAETDFRGRHYIAWYDEKVKISVGPWKFKNTPGLIYEVYDDANSFKWSLLNFKESSDEIKNPFDSYKGEVISFHKYPKLRYGLTPELKKELEKIPNNQVFEQERNGLEIEFEWEK
ncbi:GLPGLI family protein [Halpernia sp.]|uniref:GLPGLI family protein n=1 Tax=Halpernia sp. TaxID=2782209 RepID=UPI003A907223